MRDGYKESLLSELSNGIEKAIDRCQFKDKRSQELYKFHICKLGEDLGSNDLSELVRIFKDDDVTLDFSTLDKGYINIASEYISDNLTIVRLVIDKDAYINQLSDDFLEKLYMYYIQEGAEWLLEDFDSYTNKDAINKDNDAIRKSGGNKKRVGDMSDSLRYLLGCHFLNDFDENDLDDSEFAYFFGIDDSDWSLSSEEDRERVSEYCEEHGIDFDVDNFSEDELFDKVLYPYFREHRDDFVENWCDELVGGYTDDQVVEELLSKYSYDRRNGGTEYQQILNELRNEVEYNWEDAYCEKDYDYCWLVPFKYVNKEYLRSKIDIQDLFDDDVSYDHFCVSKNNWTIGNAFKDAEDFSDTKITDW